jgi:hypothetical protein
MCITKDTMVAGLTDDMLRVLRIAERDGAVVAGKGDHAGKVERVNASTVLSLIRRRLLSHIYGGEGGLGGRLTDAGRAAIAGGGIEPPAHGSAPEIEQAFIDVWMRRLAEEAANLNFEDEDDRATFRGNVHMAMRNLKWSGMDQLARHLGAEKVPRSRDGAVRAIADRYMQRHGWQRGEKKTTAQLDADIAEALARKKL